MKILLDTHILLWIAADMLPKSAEIYVLDESNDLYFSPASIWEVVIKRSLKRTDFEVDPFLLYSGLVENGYKQLHITAQHTLLSGTIPMHHKDPFDRILLAQSIAENIPILTADRIMAKYAAPIVFVKK
jgi:PIN domain nuclease of toxin-antitoxin system